MRNIFFVVFFFIYSCFSNAVKKENILPSFVGKVKKVIDGDTVEILVEKSFVAEILTFTNYTIRLLYIDSPEKEENERFERFLDKLYKNGNYLKRKEILALGQLSFSNLNKLLPADTTVSISCIPNNLFDEYGRILGVIFINQTNLNLYLVENGFAMCYFYNQKPLKEFKNAENRAKMYKKGIWKFISISKKY
jgi:endonuclease YncB( thermonuclease family)